MGKLSTLFFPKQAAKYSKSVPGCLNVGDVKVTNLEALGGSHPGITKVGRLSLSGFAGEKKVKVYTAHSEKHAELLRQLHALEFRGCQLAPLVAIEGRLIVESWVAGETVASLKPEARKQAIDQVSMFLTELSDETGSIKNLGGVEGAFCYLQNYLVERLGEWRHHNEIGSFLDGWLDDYHTLQSTFGARISHPDLSARNLILESGTGRIRVIDNELMGYGHGWILDWHNSLLPKFGSAGLAVDSDVPQDFIAKTWRLRQLGSALDEGRFDKVNRLLLDA